MSRREENKLEKLARIEDAAWTLFRELGFEATTTKAVAHLAGIGSGTLFLYARTKNELLVLLFRDELESILSSRSATVPAGLDLVGRFVHVCRGFYERYARDPELARRFVELVFVVDGTSRASMRALDRGFVVAITKAIESDKAAGILRADVDAALLAKSFFAIYGVNVIEFLAGKNHDVDRAVATLERALRMLIDGTRA